jgi:hypothetical protein
LQVENFTEDDYEVHVVVSNTGHGEVVLDRVFDMSAWDRTVGEEVFDKEEDYLVDATAGDYSAEYYFDPGDDSNAPVASLHVKVRDDSEPDIVLPAP